MERRAGTAAVNGCSRPCAGPQPAQSAAAAKQAGYRHLSIDGTLIATDRVSTPGPTEGVDDGGNIQVVTAPDGWPPWTSPVRPGCEHDTTTIRMNTEILSALAQAGRDLRTLGDLAIRARARPSPWRSRNPSVARCP